MPPPVTPPSLDEIAAARTDLGAQVRTTPTWEWRGRAVDTLFGTDTTVYLKLELFQYTGSFKVRGALLNMLSMTREERDRGVTAVSAGNHALAVGYAAAQLGCSAKVVMPRNADPARVEGCRAYGAEVVLVADVHAAFAEAERIREQEGRAFVHPFEGRQTVLGTATVGLELCRQVADLDAVVVPVGGGGLCAGVACTVKQAQPQCRVYGVEPEGADTMHRSFAAGSPQSIDSVRTIADSLGAPRAEPYSFALCRRFVDALARVDDAQLVAAMKLMFSAAKLAVEPAGAAAAAALAGPLRDELRGRRVALIVCGANILPATWSRLVAG